MDLTYRLELLAERLEAEACRLSKFGLLCPRPGFLCIACQAAKEMREAARRLRGETDGS